MTANNRLAVILVLGSTQTLAWASSCYLPAILADRIAQELGMSSTWFFAAFSAALVVSALVGPRAGRTVDAIGGREVLALSNVVIAVGLAPSSRTTIGFRRSSLAPRKVSGLLAVRWLVSETITAEGDGFWHIASISAQHAMLKVGRTLAAGGVVG